MSRSDDCLERSHIHVGVCQRAGYANGRADALDEVIASIGALADRWIAADDLTQWGDHTRGFCGRELRAAIEATNG